MKSMESLEETRAGLKRKLAELGWQEKSSAAQPVTRAKLAGQLARVEKAIFKRRQMRLPL